MEFHALRDEVIPTPTDPLEELRHAEIENAQNSATNNLVLQELQKMKDQVRLLMEAQTARAKEADTSVPPDHLGLWCPSGFLSFVRFWTTKP